MRSFCWDVHTGLEITAPIVNGILCLEKIGEMTWLSAGGELCSMIDVSLEKNERGCGKVNAE